MEFLKNPTKIIKNRNNKNNNNNLNKPQNGSETKTYFSNQSNNKNINNEKENELAPSLVSEAKNGNNTTSKTYEINTRNKTKPKVFSNLDLIKANCSNKNSGNNIFNEKFALENLGKGINICEKQQPKKNKNSKTNIKKANNNKSIDNSHSYPNNTINPNYPFINDYQNGQIVKIEKIPYNNNINNKNTSRLNNPREENLAKRFTEEKNKCLDNIEKNPVIFQNKKYSNL